MLQKKYHVDRREMRIIVVPFLLHSALLINKRSDRLTGLPEGWVRTAGVRAQ